MKKSLCRASNVIAEFLSIVVGGDVYEEPLDFFAMMESNRRSYERQFGFDDELEELADFEDGLDEDDELELEGDGISADDFEW